LCSLYKGPDKSSYYHEKFLRGKPFLALGIHQIKSRADRPVKTARACDAAPVHPNFYKMPFLPESVSTTTTAAAKGSERLLSVANKGQSRAGKKSRPAAKPLSAHDSIPSLLSEPLYQSDGIHRVSDLTLDHAAAAAAVNANSSFPMMMPSSYSGQSLSTLFPSNPLLSHHGMGLDCFLAHHQWANNHGGPTRSMLSATSPLLASLGGNGGIISRRDVHRALVSQFIESRQQPPPAPRLSPPMDLSGPFRNSALVNPNGNSQSDLLMDTLLRYQQMQQQQQQQAQLECSVQGPAQAGNSVAAEDAASSPNNPLSLLAVASYCVRNDSGNGEGY
jgi:hypothetical protein